MQLAPRTAVATLPNGALPADQLIAAGRLLFRKRAPYFQAIALKLVVREHRGLGTIAVSQTGFLIYDPIFISRQTAEIVAGLWCHEVLHIYLKHGERRGTRDPKLWNLCGDIALNCMVEDMGFQLPTGKDRGVFAEDHDLPRGKTADEYYVILSDREEPKGPEPQDGDGESAPDEDSDEDGDESGGSGDEEEEGDESEPGSGDDEQNEGDESDDGSESTEGDESDGEDGDTEEGDGGGSDDSGDESEEGGAGEGDAEEGDAGGEGGAQGDAESDAESESPKCGGGWCGSCAGRPVDGEPDETDEDARSEAEMDAANRSVAESITEAAKGRSGVPGSLVVRAAEILGPSVIPWDVKLRRKARVAVAFKAGAVTTRYDAPSRRQAGIGYGAGRPVMPRYRAPQVKCLVAVDTSASMGGEAWGRAIVETGAVMKACGAGVTFMSIDAKVQKVQRVERLADIELCGGGGTSFIPAFEAIEKMRPRVDIVVFITDGQGPAPTEAPGVTVIWVLVGHHAQRPSAGRWGGESITWGDFVEVPAEGDIAAQRKRAL